MKRDRKAKGKKYLIDRARRQLLKIGVYTAPTLISIPLSTIRAEAQTPPPGGGDLPAPPVFKEEKTRTKIKEAEEKRIKREKRERRRRRFEPKSWLNMSEDESE